VLTDLVNLAPDAILLRDSINRITFWNQGAQELYGWSAPEALGRISHALLKTRFPQGKATIDAELKCTSRWEGELTHTTRTGSILQVESRQALIRDEAGDLLAILPRIAQRDVTCSTPA
jgi:PAS domain S-box-containing protein